MLANYIYDLERVVIGNNLDAIIYAYKTNSCLLINDMVNIFSFDAINHEIDLGDISFSPGTLEVDIFNKLSYDLNLKGLNFFGSGLESIRINLEDKKISISSKFFSRQFLRYRNLHIFDTDNVHGLPFPDFEIEKYRVFDWFAVKSGTKHDLLHICDEASDLVRKIYFYISPRIAGNKRYKDLVAESLLTREHLNDVNYSDSLARLKVLRMMKDAEIKGTSHGAGYNLPLRINLQKREVFPIKSTNYKEAGIIL